MGRYSVEEFLVKTEQKDRGEGLFELESERLLELNIDGRVWTKKGSMVAYHGDIRFTREGILEHGVGKMFKKMFTGEGTRLTKAEGKGTLYLADTGKKITILELGNEAIYVNGNDLMAFEDRVKWDITFMKSISGILAAGLFNVKLEGPGLVAFTSHYDPLTLRVSADKPVMTDPNTTVAWSGSLMPQIKTDISFKTFLGRGSGESFQMKFKGEGFVVVQPYEERTLQQQATRG